MWCRSTKQRKAAQHRRAVVSSTGHAYGAEVLTALDAMKHRLSWSRLRAQGWRAHMMIDGLVRGDPFFPVKWTATVVCQRPGYSARLLGVTQPAAKGEN